MPKNAKQQVKAYLDRHAVDVKSTRSGLSFSLKGRRFQLWHDKDDPDFLRLTTPVLLDVTRDSYARVIMAANTIDNTFLNIILPFLIKFLFDKDNRSIFQHSRRFIG